MNFRPNPLLYGANEDFYSTFRLVVTMRSKVDYETFSRSVELAMERYPYFNVCPVRKGNSLVLEYNTKHVPVFDDGRCVMLGTEESNGHLLTFGCEGKKIYLDASHYIADGMGITPLLNTVLYLYVSQLFGTEGLNCDKINMPDGPFMKEEYDYPFPEKLSEPDFCLVPRKAPENVYAPCRGEDDGDELYAYHIHIPQKAMMSIANPADGSPVSFLAVMMYRAFCRLDDNIEKPVVAHVQHQYRSVLKAPMSKHSLVSYIPVVFPQSAKGWEVERQNTIVRGQVILGSEPEADLSAIKRLISVFDDDESVSLEEKKKAMIEYTENSICHKTFGISYVGKTDWCGLDKYVEDMNAYLGEKHTKHMFIIEVLTIRDDFTITFMQKGHSTRYVDAFVGELRSFGVPVSVDGGREYSVCDTKIP